MIHLIRNPLHILLMVLLICICRSNAVAAPIIRVLLAKPTVTSVTDSQLLNALQVANDVMESTMGNSDYQFVSAAFSDDAISPKVVRATCVPGLTGKDFIACAKLTLSGMRETYSADIVFLGVDIIADDIAVADPDSVNRSSIGHENEQYAYVVAELGAFGIHCKWQATTHS